MTSRLFLIVLTIFAASTLRAQTDSAAVPPDAPAQPEEKHTTSAMSLTLGVTLQNRDEGDDEVFSGNWLSGLEAKLHSERGSDEVTIFTRMRYGQQHSKEAPPQKTEDDIILSITPSIALPGLPLRLFLENTAETQFTKGMIDTFETNFMDPLLLYEALFVGNRYAWESEDASGSFDFTGGVGYALQQTVANQFVLKQNRVKITEQSPLGDQNNVTITSGYCAILEVNYSKKMSDNASLRFGFKNFALTKDDVQVDIENARATSLLSVGFQYSIVSLDYSGHLVYDHDISLRRQLDQSLVFGLRIDI
jgi:hypothetical protein